MGVCVCVCVCVSLLSASEVWVCVIISWGDKTTSPIHPHKSPPHPGAPPRLRVAARPRPVGFFFFSAVLFGLGVVSVCAGRVVFDEVVVAL